MNYNNSPDTDTLARLTRVKSKHSGYQVLHPKLAALVPEIGYHPPGKYEEERLAYMTLNQPLVGLRVLDIGANTGYFSLAAIEGGALHVVSHEGNREHAEFISLGARCLGLEHRLEVRPTYFNFSSSCNVEQFDVVLCLNVLHHLGDDFGDPTLSLEAAKKAMIAALNRLASSTASCWMQLGFNWKGNPHRPLFANGTKQELIDFVQQGIEDNWDIERIGVVDPTSRCYVDADAYNLERFDGLGEFSNRPLFLLQSRRN